LSKSSANFLRCAWLLNGMTSPGLTRISSATAHGDAS